MARWSRLSRSLLLAAVCSATSACSDESGPWPPVQTGELGFADFRYCDGEDLLDCTAPVPRDFALDASFGLTFSVTGGVPHEVRGRRIVSASSHIVEPLGNTFQAVGLGSVALLATSLDDEVIDLLRVRVHPVTRIGVTAQPCGNSCSPPSEEQVVYFERDTAVTVTATAWNGDVPLGGNVRYQWTSLTPDVLAVTSQRGSQATLLLEGGLGEVRVTHGNVSEDVTIVVGRGPVRATTYRVDESTSGDGMDTDSSTTAATDTDDTATSSGTDADADTDADTMTGTSLGAADDGDTEADTESTASSGAAELERRPSPGRRAAP